MLTEREMTLLIKQNALKNGTVLILTIVLTLWVEPYTRGVGHDGVDAFFFMGIFPLGAMFAYFAFRYSDTNLHSVEHRILADVATFVFMLIICFSITFATVLAFEAFPRLTAPFAMMAVLLIFGCIVYDFWNLYCNIKRQVGAPPPSH